MSKLIGLPEEDYEKLKAWSDAGVAIIDGTATGDLTEIKRIFVQNGQVFEHPDTKLDDLDKQYNSITDEMCEKVKGVFTDTNDFKKKGGLKKMG